MAYTANDVKNLREQTGAGMMDCKKALAASDGDMDKAVQFLREKGLAAAQKKAGRIAAEGIVYAYVAEDGAGVIVEVNSETDFVAKNDKFQGFVHDIAAVIEKERPADVDALMNLTYPGTELTVAGALQEKILTIGENLKIRRFEVISGETNVAYVHMAGRIGVLVNMKVSDNLKGNAAVEELGKDIAMQAAAMRPSWLDRSNVDEATLENERQVLMTQTMAEGKPEAVAQKIVAGRLAKFYEETCLLQQPFVKENKISVEKHVAAVAKELGGTIEVIKFVRFEKGEGLAKREDNFADEVASMIK